MSATDRYMCLACGRFWRSQRPTQCPYCTDMYYVDNVILDAPPPPDCAKQFDCSCGNVMQIDFPGDFTGCSVCKKTGEKGEGTQFEYQLKKLGELGI